jgi:hypothetical protein
MTNHAITAAACAALGLLIAEPAAARCALKAQQIPIKMIDGRPMVTAKVNGKAGNFVIDSGSPLNQISRTFAATLKLAPPLAPGSFPKPTDPPVVATAAQFEFAGAQLTNVPLVASFQPDKVDGVIGQTVLRQADVEYDLGGGAVRLIKAEGCEGPDLVYWAKDGDSYSEIPLEPMDKDAPLTKSEVTINGVKLRAMFKSSVPFTMITEQAALKAGVKMTDPGVKTLTPTVSVGNFASVKIGDEEFKNAPLEIGKTRDTFYDVIIGTDWLAAHHMYVANSQQKIFFTYSGGPGTQVFTAHAASGMSLRNGAGIAN